MSFNMITGNFRFKSDVTEETKATALVDIEGLSATIYSDQSGTYQFYLPGVASLDSLRTFVTTYETSIESFETFLCDYTVIDSMTYPSL